MSINLKKSGILTTVQDLGRNGFRKFGINPNGAMDKRAVRLINILLGNNENEAVLEMHFPAPILEFEDNAIFAIGGADFGAKLDDQPINSWRPCFAQEGQTLSFSNKRFGNRAYLSIKEGFEIEPWLGSSATNLTAGVGGFKGRKCENNDQIFFKKKLPEGSTNFNYQISNDLIPQYNYSPTVRVITGVEFEMLTGLAEETFLKNVFTITANSDRMGFHLEGKLLYLLDSVELISSAVEFGTIQLLPNGQMIILMADHQTTGGYPRIAHVISEDLPLLAQLGANDKISFEIVTLSKVERLFIQFERELEYFKLGCRFKNIN